MMMMTPKRKNKAGAPLKKKEVKKKPDGFTNSQHDWLEREAKGRGCTVAEIKREALDFYITGLEKQRGDATVSELFNDKEQ